MNSCDDCVGVHGDRQVAANKNTKGTRDRNDNKLKVLERNTTEYNDDT